jgi:peptide/nickel transport system substrate-binding protein
MTPTVAEYPDDATEMYGYDPTKALEYFTTAGYALDADGKLVKDGEQLQITVGIGGNGEMNHPSAPILTQMANDMAKMGAELIIQDLDFSTLVNMKDGGELDMWVMAWGNSTDCDLTQIFGSKGNDNDCKFYSDEVDALQAEILKTVDFDQRSALVAQELDIIMEGAVYMPIYQRKNMEIYNSATLNLDTLPEETTTYWNYASQINKLEMQ